MTFENLFGLVPSSLWSPPMLAPEDSQPFLPNEAAVRDWHPPLERPWEHDLACSAPYADARCAESDVGEPGPEPDRSSRPPEGVVGAQALRDELNSLIMRDARRSYESCVEGERKGALATCKVGSFPDNRDRPDASMGECVSMWLDGVPDRTDEQSDTYGDSWTQGGGFEAGWQGVLSFNANVSHTGTKEKNIGTGYTSHGAEGLKARCFEEILKGQQQIRDLGKL